MNPIDMIATLLGFAAWAFLISVFATKGRSADVVFGWIYQAGVRHRKRKGTEQPWER